MDLVIAIIIAVGCLILGGVLGFCLFRYIVKQKYNQIIKEAEIEAETLKNNKQLEMKEKFPQAEIYCFYMDLRLFGKKYEDFYINAQRDFGVHFIRGRVSEVGETIDGRIQVKAEDTLSGKPLKVQLDTLVLMSGMVCNKSVSDIASQVRLETDDDGFLRSKDNIYDILRSNRPGIFYAGACTGTKTVPETLAEGRAAAVEIHNYLKDG